MTPVGIDPDSVAIQIVWIVVGILVVLSLYLLFTSVIIRYAQLLVDRTKEKRRTLYYGLIIHYITGESDNLGTLSSLIKSPFEIEILVDMVTDLMSQLDGLEYPRLQDVLALPVVRNHYRAKLFSTPRPARIEACLYFARVSGLQKDETTRIRSFLDDKSTLLSHAAATVMMASTDVDIRFEALRRVAIRKRVSKLAMLEMMHLFHSSMLDQFDEESERIGELLRMDEVPAHNMAVIIRSVVDVGYSQLLIPLFDLLESGYRKDQDDVVESLLYTMGKFQFSPAGDWMVSTTLRHPNPRIRKATAQAFEDFQDARFVPALMELAQDSEITVRIRAIYALVASGPQTASALTELSERASELRELIERIRLESEAAA